MKRTTATIILVMALVGCGSAVSSSGVAGPSGAQVTPVAAAAASSPDSSAAQKTSPAGTPSSTPDRPTTYTFQASDTPSRIAHMFGVSLKELVAANPQADWSQIRNGQVLNLPANATWPSPTPEPAPSVPAQTYPPLPAIAVVAGGKFTRDEGISPFTVGTTLSLEFRFDGGPVTGSGSVPAYRRDGPTCKFTERTKVTFSGTFDPLTRQITGSAQSTDTITVSYATTDACKSLAGTTKLSLPWTAQVSEDGKSVSGSVTKETGPREVQPFVATISPAD